MKAWGKLPRQPLVKIKSRKDWERFRHSCAFKLAHGNYLTAMHHAAGLRKKDPHLYYGIYECLYCTGLHVGRRPTSPEISESFEGFNVESLD